ncbi:hypothetical protein HQ585_12395 [candidate division KSB1 bacterium]|nr:hypothetical protein [candidate division KSB1 bacterium]
MLKDKKILTFISSVLIFLFFSCQLFAQGGRHYEGPDDPAADRAAMREGVMDGNQFLTVFRNNTQIGYKYMIDGSKWPKDSEKGLQIFDVLSVLVGAQVFLEQDTIPVTDEAQIISRTDLDTLYYIQTIWNYEGMLDLNPEGDIVWGFHAVPGYFNELSETPAISNDSLSWPPGGWPSRGAETKWPGEWNGRFGRGVKYAQLESYFVANDAQDQEYVQPDRRVKYFPRPGVKIGDKSPDVTIQKGQPWGGLGLRVEVRGYQWENPQTRDVIFWEYNISNISEYSIPRTTFGFFIDMGVGNAFNFGDDADDLGGFDESTDMAFIWDANNVGAGGYAPGTCGITFLESPGIGFDEMDNDDDGLTDEARDNFAMQLIGPTAGITDLTKFMDYYGYNSVDQLAEHWDADEDQDWRDGEDTNGNGIYDNGESAGDDVGLDGVGPGDLNYYGPDADGTECNHRPDLLEGLNSEPNFGLNDISESDMLGLTSFHFLPWPGNNPPCPKFDEALYSLIGPPGLHEHTGDAGDYAPVFGSGVFNLERGTTERISCAMIGAYENVATLNSGGSPYTLIEKKRIVQLIYESDYRFARPPETPTLHASAHDGKVVLTWDNRAEKFTREPLLGGENDFEGYKLYKATDRFFADAQRVFDGFGNPSGKVPVFQCDLNNDIYGFTDYGLLQGESFFLGNNTGIQHYYEDEDVQNGRTYYYYLVAYDHGIKGIDANVAPAENVASIQVDENENITRISKNVQIMIPHQLAAGFIPSNIEVTPAHGDIKGTGDVSFEILDELALKDGNEYKLGFVIDTVKVFGSSSKGYPFPNMGYRYRNIGFTVYDVTDSNNVLLQETPEMYSGDNILYDNNSRFYYMNPNISSDPFGGIKFTLSDVPSIGAEYDSTSSGWITGNAPIQLTVGVTSYVFFPWRTDIVFTAGDITCTTQAVDISTIRKVDGISPFDKSLLLPDQTFNFYIENKQFQDSLGFNYLLDIIAYDTNENGQFDLLEDDVAFGYSSMEESEMKWQISIGSFNFRNAASESELPNPGDVYRLDSHRPFTGSDELMIKVIEPSEEKERVAEDLDKIKVVPNPYIVTNMMEPAVRNIFLNQRRRIMFTHIPAHCEIKIFSISGYLVDEIDVNNEPHNGIVHWDLLTKYDLEVAPGIYVYHLKSKTTGKEKMGKFAIIK